MNSTQTAVVATLTVRVPINAAGSLADGATAVVERIDAVDRLEEATVRGLNPALNETTVDLRVRLVLAPTPVDERPDATTVRTELEDGVGIKAVEDVRTEIVETADADRPPTQTASVVD
ncbi:hypothetical protein C483_16428 [Natrialba hulunbeirensis JCM 10989]|uniref:Uncharacterized protein n=1 Tax=Natrialba hulunbeirensis JCM 10989 TaxID=1227493 RepID=L9ZPC0_9EURY|nr:hypothetical protein [Natrialba hulunbeirensis]ELY87911.1 hypothetical protein C483_16428 [Natrialba hulunbeirensis JCM 10989]